MACGKIRDLLYVLLGLLRDFTCEAFAVKDWSVPPHLGVWREIGLTIYFWLKVALRRVSMLTWVTDQRLINGKPRVGELHVANPKGGG